MNYWKRYISFTIGQREYKAPFVLEFSTSFSTRGCGNTRAAIYNPSDETIENVEPRGGENQTIIIDAGFEDDHGICIIGEVYEYDIKTMGTERILTMSISDSATRLSTIKICRTWHPDVKASVIINDLISESGIDAGKVNVRDNKTYPRGITLNTTLVNAFEQMAKDTHSDFFIRNEKIYFQTDDDEGIKTGILLSPATGLIEKPVMVSVKNGNGNIRKQGSVKSLFNYKIGSGEQIRIESETFTGDCRVISGEHNYSEENASTLMEVMQL